MSVDVTSDDEGAKKFRSEKGITFPALRGSWAWAGQAYGVSSTPQNFILDREGRILFAHGGFHGPKGIDQMGYEIEAILAR